MQAINEAAPGLSLFITEDIIEAIVHVRATDKEETYTEGNILMQSTPGNSNFIVTIYLSTKWKDDRKKGISFHELLHALGFHHEHQSPDAPPYVYRFDSGKEITINKNWLDLARFDPRSFSVMLNPCEKRIECSERPETSAWVLKADLAQENMELSELDKVGLNLVYRPCIIMSDDNVRYQPILGKNGLYYCGREVICDLTYPYEGDTNGICGPHNGPNCPACRTIKSPKVKEILNGGRWQGMTGLVYCGRPFIEPGQLHSAHDGMCGVNNGPACPECVTILKNPSKTVSAKPMKWLLAY